MCIDYRKINQISKRDSYPVPNLELTLNKLQNAQFVLIIDLSIAFFPMAVESRHISAFVVPGKGIFEWTRMSFGLKGATATFQRAKTLVITSEMSLFAMAYVDDIIIATADWESHMYWLRQVIMRILAAGFTINRKKSFFGKTEIRYLGFIVDCNGTRIDYDKTRPVMKYPVPNNLKQLRSYLEMFSWYRRYIPDFAKISKPFYC